MTRPRHRELIFQLVETARLLRTHMDKRAKPYGTTRAQWGVLGRLRRNEGLMQVDLAEQLELSPIALGGLIDKLEMQGHVERRPDPKDNRAYRIYLTVKGRAFVESLDELRSKMANELLGGVTEAALATTLDTLEHIKSGIKVHDPQSYPITHKSTEVLPLNRKSQS